LLCQKSGRYQKVTQENGEEKKESVTQKAAFVQQNNHNAVLSK
jgi:hypothetical protein